MIYFMPICDTDQMEEQYRAWLPHLPPTRQRKLMQYRFAKDRWLCAAAYMLLLHALQNEHGITEEQVKIEVEESGKPYLASHPHIFFNLSHCDLGVVCGLGSAPIGVDVEAIRNIDQIVVKRVCNMAEQDIIACSGSQAHTFTEMWTLKESFIKAIGCGLSCSLADISVKVSAKGSLHISQDGYDAYVLEQLGSYCISVCGKTEAPTQNSLHKVKSALLT